MQATSESRQRAVFFTFLMNDGVLCEKSPERFAVRARPRSPRPVGRWSHRDGDLSIPAGSSPGHGPHFFGSRSCRYAYTLEPVRHPLDGKETPMSRAPLNTSLTDEQLDQQCINTIRTLWIDAIQQAKSGHPGTLMALAPLVYTIWNRVLRFDPQDPIWPNRDRFVLSNGHASMLLWSALHLTKTRAVNAEYEILGQPAVTLEDIHHFRQLNSKAAGRCLRSSVIGWPSGTRQSLLDLRQQSHLARGKHALGLHRRCRVTISSLWMETFFRWGCK